MPSDASRVVAVVQARVGSSRLPGKVLRPLGGRRVIDWVTRAARAASSLDDVVVAISEAPGDDLLHDHLSQQGIRVVRGSEEDVLSRFLRVLEEEPCAAVVRLTADCPLLDPRLIDLVVRTWRGNTELDYVSTVTPRSLPRGLDVELIRGDTLRSLGDVAHEHHRTHVTSYIYTHADHYSILGLAFSPSAADLRVTLDTAEDAELIEEIASRLGDAPPDWRQIVRVLRADDSLRALNSTVRQKGLEEG